LHICAERGFVDIAVSLLAKFPWLIYETDEVGNLALHVACDWDQIYIVKLICETGDETLAQIMNGEGKTCVDVAFEANTQEAYPYLCSKYRIP
jgi:ankyrin repeat protein